MHDDLSLIPRVTQRAHYTGSEDKKFKVILIDRSSKANPEHKTNTSMRITSSRNKITREEKKH